MDNNFSSKERLLTAIELGEPDFVPITPNITWHYAPKLFGHTISEYVLGTNKFRAKLLLNAQKKLGYDWIMAMRGNRYDWRDSVDIKKEGNRYVIEPKEEGYRFGRWRSKFIVPIDDEPYHLSSTDGYLENIEDYSKINITDTEAFLQSGELEQAKIISEKVGKKVLVVGHLGGPFTSGVGKVGLKKWIMTVYKKPDIAGKVMMQSIEQSLEYARAQKEVGVEAYYIEECYAGADVIPPTLFEKIVLPYEKIHLEKLNELGSPTILSFTGNPMPILDEILETNASGHHFEESKKGFIVDIEKIRAKLRGKACMFIPFDAVNILPSGNLDLVEKKVREIILGTAEGGGVALSTGCPVLRDTPVESIISMIQTARKFGKYPIHQLD
jgi:uroporphyrinogen-III decarboxylase